MIVAEGANGKIKADLGRLLEDGQPGGISDKQATGVGQHPSTGPAGRIEVNSGINAPIRPTWILAEGKFVIAGANGD
jgi:hypothetical protein